MVNEYVEIYMCSSSSALDKPSNLYYSTTSSGILLGNLRKILKDESFRGG